MHFLGKPSPYPNGVAGCQEVDESAEAWGVPLIRRGCESASSLLAATACAASTLLRRLATSMCPLRPCPSTSGDPSSGPAAADYAAPIITRLRASCRPGSVTCSEVGGASGEGAGHGEVSEEGDEKEAAERCLKRGLEYEEQREMQELMGQEEKKVKEQESQEEEEAQKQEPQEYEADEEEGAQVYERQEAEQKPQRYNAQNNCAQNAEGSGVGTMPELCE